MNKINKYGGVLLEELPTIEELYDNLKNVDSLKPHQFGNLVGKISDVLKLDNETISKEFGISILTAQRWRTGKSSPSPMERRMVYNWLENLIKTKL